MSILKVDTINEKTTGNGVIQAIFFKQADALAVLLLLLMLQQELVLQLH